MSFGALTLKVSGTIMPASAPANPARVRQGQLTQNTSSLVIPFDDGSTAAAGELLVASVRYSTNGQTPVAPGWGDPVVTQPFLSGTAQAQALFVKIADGTETGITVDMGPSFLCSGTVSGWSNAKAGTATSGQFVVKGTGGTFGPSDAPVSPNAIPLMSFAFASNSSWTFSSPWAAYPAANQLTMFAQEPAPGAAASGVISGPSLSATWINLWIEPKS